jgi:Flp pilus assembly protein TadD
MALGMTYAREGNLDAAIAEIEAAVARRPTWAHARANLGLLLLKAGRPVDAAEHLDAAATLEPGNAQVESVLARLRRQGITTNTTPVADRRSPR